MREALVPLLLITAAAVLVYSNTFGASFHLDDIPNIVENDGLRDLRLQWPPSGSRWLGYFSFALNYRLGGLEVFGYHAVNVLVHACNGVLVLWLTSLTLRTPALRRADASALMRRYLPLTAGVLFVVHPVATQAVTYVVQRFTSLATLFFLLSLALYAQARISFEVEPRSKARAASLYCLSILGAVAAMKTKEISATLPLVAAGYELLFFRSGKRRFLLLAPLAASALFIPLALATHGRDLLEVLSNASRTAAETDAIPRSVYLLTQSRVVVTYLRLLLVPIRQNLDYDFRLSYSLADPDVLVALAILLAVAGGAAFLLVRARSRNRAAGVLVFFGVAWFFLTLSVESSVIPIRDVIFEHRMYLPSAGAAVALGTALLWAVERLHSRSSIGARCAAALLVTAGPLGAATYARNSVWKDETTLWSDVVSKSPRKARPHDELGSAYAAKGRLEDAVGEFLEAIRLDSHDPAPHHHLGVAYWAKGQADDAVRELRVAIGFDPSNSKAHSNLGNAYWAKGQADDAAREYREAIRLDPRLPQAHCGLGMAHWAEGRVDEAEREYREAIRLDPAMAEAHYNLGGVLAQQGRGPAAVAEYREAIRLAPAMADAHSNLGNILAKQGRHREAVEEFRRAFELKPTPETTLKLAVVLDRSGRVGEAIVEYQRFLDQVGENEPDRAAHARTRLSQLRASSDSIAR